MGNREKGKIKLTKQEFTGKAKKKKKEQKKPLRYVFLYIFGSKLIASAQYRNFIIHFCYSLGWLVGLLAKLREPHLLFYHILKKKKQDVVSTARVTYYQLIN